MTNPRFTCRANGRRADDRAAADRLIERFGALGRAEARLAAQPEIGALLAALGGNSPFLADLAIREAASLRRLATEGPDAVAATAMAALIATAPPPRATRSRRLCGGPSGSSR